MAHITRSKGDRSPPPNRHGLETLIHIIREAEDSGVRVGIENTQNPEHLHYLFSRHESPCLGLCYDSSHDFLYSPEPGLLLREWGHLLCATHLSDNDGLADRHWLPGEGIIDWNLVKSLFPHAAYRGSLNLEIFPKDPGRETPLKFLKKAHARARWLEKMFEEGSGRQ